MIKAQNMEILIQKSCSHFLDEVIKRNIYELDLALWCLLKDLAYQRPEIVVRQFQISLKTAKQVARAEQTILHKIASGGLFSFQLNTAETELIEYLENPYNLAPLHTYPLKEGISAIYWFILNQIAKHDVDLACLYFGVSPRLAKATMHADYKQLIHLANTIPLQFSLRCTEQSVLDCLSNHDIHASLKKQFTILKNIEMVEKNTQMTEITDLARLAVAHEMALSGYSKVAISLQTGIGREQCRCFLERLRRQGYILEYKKGRLRSGLMLVRNREGKIQTSLLMLIYCILGGHIVYEFIQLPALKKAFWQYREMQKSYSMHHWADLNINDAWSLARELRDKEAYIKSCRSCHLPYFTSVRQYTSVDCPFCPL